jgi:hypothetical protein
MGKYEEYPQNNFRLQVLPLQRCGYYGAHECHFFSFAFDCLLQNSAQFSTRATQTNSSSAELSQLLITDSSQLNPYL